MKKDCGDAEQDLTETMQCLPFDDLPNDIVDNILNLLPIKDAVRTSILSRKLRFRWNTIPNLKFDNQCIETYKNLETCYQLDKLVRIVDSVLLQHDGPIRGFQLLADSAKLPCWSDVNRWLIYLSRNHVQKITLRFTDRIPFSVPSHLFSCESLTCLELTNCRIKLPADFQGFAALSALTLDTVFDLNGRLESLVSNCPRLKLLSLYGFRGSSFVNICAPNLEEFFYLGRRIKLHFEPTRSLVFAYFCMSSAGFVQNPSVTFDCIENIEVLDLCLLALQLLVDFGIGKKAPYMLHRLKILCIVVDFCVMEHVFTALSLLRNATNLQVLNIQAASIPGAAIWVPLVHIDFTLDHLETVNLKGLIGVEQELHFAEVIFAVAPVLRTVTVSIDRIRRVKKDGVIIMELMRFQRASPHAVILSRR